MEYIRVNNKIRLEKTKLSMAETIFSAIDTNREFLKTWLPFVETTLQILDTEKFLQSIIQNPSKTKNEVYSIWYQEEFAGLIGFNEIDWLNKKAELGYWIIEKMQGKGIVSQSAEKLIRYSFQKLKLNRIQIKVAVGNYKSSAIPKKLGFTFEGIEKEGENYIREYRDLEIYSLLKKD